MQFNMVGHHAVNAGPWRGDLGVCFCHFVMSTFFPLSASAILTSQASSIFQSSHLVIHFAPDSECMGRELVTWTLPEGDHTVRPRYKKLSTSW